jgi:hypothetical protein
MDAEKNKHIIKYLDYYCALNNSPEFAILLRGKWGSGKSWFIKKYLEENYRENFLYVSLNGVTSYSEIEDTFFEQIHPLLSSKGMKLAGKLLKGIIKTTIKVDLDIGKNEDINITSGLSDINLPSYLKKLDGKIIIFDDLERCALPINQILGYINQYVENKGMKVLLIANEEEIINTDNEDNKTDNAKRYLTIKEKIIGKSFDIQPDEVNALEDFICLVESADCKEYLKSKSILILILFTIAGYQNLRHLKQALLDYERFYELLDKNAKDNNALMDHLLNLFLIISFEIKKGMIQENDLTDLFSFSFLIKKDNDGKSSMQSIRNKYPIFKDYGFHPLSAEIWTELFKAGVVNRKKLNDELLESWYLSKEEQPDWKKLYYFTMLNDDELNGIYKNVYKDFTAFTIDNPYEIIQITGILILLSKLGLIDLKDDIIITLGKDNLEAMKARGQLVLWQLQGFPGDHSHAMGYAGMGTPIFEEFLRYSAKLVVDNEFGKQPVRAAELFDLLKISINAFKNKLDINQPSNFGYARLPIFNYIDVNEFADFLIILPNREKTAVFDILENRYSYSYDNRLQPEREWLELLLAVLTEKKKELEGKISGYILQNTIIPGINKSLNRIPK